MKRTIPLLITAVGGLILVASAFIPAMQKSGERVTVWFNILAAVAMILGGANLAQVQLKKISDRKAGWGYAAVILISFVVTLAIGLSKLGVRPDVATQYPGEIWQPVPLDVFPTYTYAPSEKERPSVDAMAGALPASVQSQLTIDRETGQLNFQGWMSDEQRGDLIDASDDVFWKAAVEQLANVAKPPERLDGKVLHRGDRGMLAVVGTLDGLTAGALHDALPDAGAAIDQLQAAAEQKTDISIGQQGKFQSSVIGAMTSAKHATRLREYTKTVGVTGWSAEEANALADTHELSDESRTAFIAALTRPIDVDAMVAAINSKAEAVPQPRSWTDIAADVAAGNPAPPLETVTKDDPLLLDDQVASLQTLARKHANVDEFLNALAQVAPDHRSQTAAAEAFLLSQPTNNERLRDATFELLKANAIDRATADLMLQPYRDERATRRAMELTYVRSQQIKFAFAGDYNKGGSAFWWIYEYLFKPLTATMFAMLAFYISSAAFRAFRAKNLEAGLLLGTAFLVLLGRTSVGVWLTDWMPGDSPLRIENITQFVMKAFNTAGNRAIMIGIALGIISTSLKVLLGIDRSYLGKE